MKSVVAPLVLAIALAAVGATFWIAGQTERRLSDIHNQLATLQYSSVTADSEDAEQSLGLANRVPQVGAAATTEDRKSTRLNSSHVSISYAVFCLKKKKRQK